MVRRGALRDSPFTCSEVDCEQSLFCSKIRRENERDGMRDIRAASGEAVSRVSSEQKRDCSQSSSEG